MVFGASYTKTSSEKETDITIHADHTDHVTEDTCVHVITACTTTRLAFVNSISNHITLLSAQQHRNRNRKWSDLRICFRDAGGLCDQPLSPKRSDYVVPVKLVNSFFFAILAEKTLRESKAPDSTWPKNNARCSVA